MFPVIPWLLKYCSHQETRFLQHFNCSLLIANREVLSPPLESFLLASLPSARKDRPDGFG
jgi:hypothetical protein